MSTVVDDVRGTPDSAAAAIATADRSFVARPSSRIPVAVAGGRGATIVDAAGRELLDFTSGWNVTNTGWNHPAVVAAVQRQAGMLAFAPPWCTHQGRPAVAERLSDLLGGDFRALCGANGSEAVEAALKVARRATGRHAVVGFTEAYHGGTLGALLAGGVPNVPGVYLPADGVHRHAPIPDQLRADGRDYGKLASEVITADPAPAAVLLEPMFTNPGVLYGDAEFYASIGAAARAVGALVIMDEIGTGFGRTGRMFGFEHWPITPDIVVVAKALSSGAVPMSAALLRGELAPAVGGAGFSSTFGWTPLACAAAEATLDVITTEGLVERAHALGELALARLAPLVDDQPHVAAVRGHGLELGIELVDEAGDPLPWPPIGRLIRRLLDRGVFAEPSSYTSTLLLMPPLVIGEAELERGLDAVAEEICALAVPEVTPPGR
ncbi:MAG: aspartate aminotransferase family protein [Sporichthyaceae bacterium]|nr:aspartate aminotransferase family protein [Sporichthyaceae bacterium]